MEEEEELPGTWRLVDDGNIVLSPTPSQCPNDPLCWSRPRKYWHAALVCFIAGLTAATANDAGSAIDGQNEDLGISYGTENTSAGILFATIGVTTYLLSPSSWLYGRRVSYLICMLAGLAGAIWLACVQNTSDSIWNQLFVGASEACAEANVQLSLSDLFFEHQLGSFIGVYVLATSVGTFLGPMIASYIADSHSLGWRWIGWMAVIFSAVVIVAILFTLEETVFERPSDENTPMINAEKYYRTENTIIFSGGTDVPYDDDKNTTKNTDIAPSSIEMGMGVPTTNPNANKPKTYWQRIALVTPASNIKGTGFKQYASRLFHTLRLFGFPAVIFSGFQWGAQDAWLSFYLTLEEDYWIGPPWNYDDAAIGLMNLPSIIGATIGCIYGGYVSDLFVIWMARRNNGIREAEHRLWFLLPCAFISSAGMFLFGFGTAFGFSSWHAPYVGLGLIGFGWGCVGDLSMTYCIECYSMALLEGMACIAVVNNLMACIFTFCVEPWLDSSGIESTFIVLGVLDFVIVMLAVPMIVWGKRCRLWTKERYLRFLQIRDSI